MREILSRYLGLPAGEITFDYSANGKPMVRGGRAPGFNLSHSGSVGLLVVATTEAIGVDVERARPLVDMPDLLERFFSDAERREIENYPPVAMTDAFYRCWTRKEALVKAVGEGLSAPQRFSVECGDIARPRVLGVPESCGPASRWNLVSVPVSPGYVSAVASDTAIASLALLRPA
jgi:4'-phosphopantetheinyl transferase